MSPNTLRIASASAASLSGVDVPCAFTCPIVGGVEAGVVERELHARGRALAAGRRRGDVVRVGVAAVAERPRRRCVAPRATRAVPALEHAEAPRLRPSRSRRGRRRTAATRARDRRCGVLSAVMRANAEIASGRDATPRCRRSSRRRRCRRGSGAPPSPIALRARRARGGDAEVRARSSRSCIAIVPAVAFVIIIGTKNGLTRPAPFSR